MYDAAVNAVTIIYGMIGIAMGTSTSTISVTMIIYGQYLYYYFIYLLHNLIYLCYFMCSHL